MSRRRKLGGYSLGRLREYYVMKKFEQRGWVVIRASKSAGGRTRSSVKPIDLVASKEAVSCYIQVARKRDDISRSETQELSKLSKIAGALPLLVWVQGRKYYCRVVGERESHALDEWLAKR